jgi:hypothetical protein
LAVRAVHFNSPAWNNSRRPPSSAS